MATAAHTTYDHLLAEWDNEHAYPAARLLEKAWLLPDGYCMTNFPDQWEREVAEAERIWAAMLLSGGNLRVCVALLKNTAVPSRLINAA